MTSSAATPAPPTTDAAALEARVAVRRGGLDLDVDLALAHEVTVLVGPNGAGKSTLLGAIAGTVATAGRVRLHGRVLSDDHHAVPLHERRIGLVFQEPVLLPHRSLEDNVAFARAGGRRIRDDDRAAARAALAAMGLEEPTIRARPAEVSGGQAQRAALARATVTRPEALLLDEPLAAVDATGRQALRTLLRRQLRAFDGPSLVVTHDLADIATLADRVVVLETGRVTADTDLPTLATRPTSPFVADLVGVNLYRGVADGTRVDVVDHAPGQRPIAITVAEPADGDVHLAFPPRAVALFREPPAGSPRNTFMGVVDRIDPLGDRLRVHLEGTLDLVAEVTPGAAHELGLGEGTRLHAVVKATEVQVYPR